MTERDIFLGALDIPDPAARAAYLDGACRGDTALRGRVEALLRSHEEAGSFLNLPALTPSDSGAAPTRALDSSADPGDGPTRTEGGGIDDETDDALAFLVPAQRPDSLGRIDHYEVLEVLGRGGFGVVFRAFDEVLQRVVAVKMLAPSMAATSPARKRFLREARSAAPIQHENVVRIHETGEQPLPYLVMEFVAGETLQQKLDRTGPLETAEALKIARQIAEGLAAAHEKGLIHRDIKPSNILIERAAGERAKITDFGLARAADDASLTRSGTVAGTPMYMAPEQAKGEALDHRADLFSLGSVLYAMLTGRPPFRAETTLAVLKRVAEDTPRPIREVIPEVPEWLCRVVEKLHAKNPADRFQTAREVADLLADCERQLAAHKELRDYSHIPGGAPKPAARSSGRRAEAELLLATVGVAAVTAAMLFTGWPFVLVLIVLLGISIANFIPARDATTARRRSPARRFVAAAAAFLVLTFAAVWGEAFAVRYVYNRAEVTFNESADPDVEKLLVRRNGELVATLDRANPRTTLTPGDYELEAVCIDSYEATKFHVETTRLFSATGSFERVEGRPVIKLAVRRGDRATVAATAERRGLSPNPAKDGWVQLFDGQHLTGLKTHPKMEGRGWSNTFGDLKLNGPTHLFTERVYTDFHLQIEAKCAENAEPILGVRAPFDVDDAGRVRCRGTGLGLGANTTYSVQGNKAIGPVENLKPGDWYTQEWIVQGDVLTVKVNGQQVLQTSGLVYPSGHVVLTIPPQHLHVRKIEIKDLSSVQPALTARDREDLARLKGEWLVHSAELEEKPLPPKNTEGMTIRFGDGEFELRQPGVTVQPETGPFRIDAANKQLLFHFKHATVPVRCSYRIDGDRLRLSFGSWDRKKSVDAADFIHLRDRVQSRNKLVALSLAMHAYHDRYGGLPRAAITDPKAKGGKPLLSWRVAILPFLEQDALYKQFKLDEPWDSEHNKKLIDKMPAVFAAPGTEAARPGLTRISRPSELPVFIAGAEPGLTHYRVFVGPGTAFEPLPNRDFGVQLTEMPDGAAGTLMIVESAEPVVWTKPDDLPFDPKQPLPKLGVSDVYTHVALCDGKVEALAPDAAEKTIRALVTRNGGENVSAPFLKPIPTQGPPLYLECLRRGAPLSDADRVQGTWVPIGGEVDGKPMTEEELQRFSEVRFSGTSFQFQQDGAPVKAEFRLAPEKTPKEIDIIQPGTENAMPGIYRFRGESLELCLGSAMLPRPGAFATAAGSRLVFVTLKCKAEPPTDKQRLQGEWIGESAERNGVAIPKDQAAQIRVRFDGGNVRITMPGGKADEGTFKLDPEVSPKQIDCSGAADQKTRYGIYRFLDDRLEICMGEKNERPKQFDSKGDDPTRMRITLRRAPAGGAFVPLFNGNDLTGFIVLPNEKNNWKVADGVLTCTGPTSHLFTGRGDYQNFHARLVARINDKGNSGLFFRVLFEQNKLGFPPGYEAQINSTHPDPNRTGSLYNFAPFKESLVRPGEWFTLDVIADGNRIVIKVNGRTTVDFVDPKNTYSRGHFALQHHNPGTAVEIRSFEVKELSPPEPVFRPLFNGKDLTGWKVPKDTGAWKVEGDLLVGRGPGFLFSERADYRDFHYRIEAKIVTGWGQQLFRYTSGEEPRYGYKAYMHAYDWEAKTGSVASRFKGDGGAGTFLQQVKEKVIARDTWFTQEVIVRGPRITVILDGKTVAETLCKPGDAHHHALGCVGLEVSKDSHIEVRKIEIKELPPEPEVGPPAKKDEPNPATAKSLKELVEIRTHLRDDAQLRFDAGKINKIELLATEIELTEARVKLAEEDRKPETVVALLEELVTQRQQQRLFIKARVDNGIDRELALLEADARIAQAKIRLALARPPEVAPAPRAKP